MTPCPKPVREKKKKYNGGIKTDEADKWFSLCVRIRCDWTCEYCGTHHEPEYSLVTGLPKNPGFHCSHFYSRGNLHWSTRTNPDNANGHCYYCHIILGGNHPKFCAWKEKQLGSERYAVLAEISEDSVRGKAERQGHKSGETAAHYKAEAERMMKLRAQGVIGRIEFTGWL